MVSNFKVFVAMEEIWSESNYLVLIWGKYGIRISILSSHEFYFHFQMMGKSPYIFHTKQT